MYKTNLQFQLLRVHALVFPLSGLNNPQKKSHKKNPQKKSKQNCLLEFFSVHVIIVKY